MKPERVLAIVVGSIVLLAIVAAVVVALRPEPEFDPGTPEGTVQAFLQAVLDDDMEAAARFLDPAGDCERDDLERSGRDQAARVVLDDVDIDGDTARVDVRIVRSGDGGPFDSYEYEEEQTFHLKRSGEDWVLTGEPWPLFFCEEDDQ